MNRRLLAASSAALSLLLVCSCTVGPDYKRPQISMPAAYRGAEATPKSDKNFAQADWWTIFRDPVLKALIDEALRNNYDVRIAANHVIQASEQLGVTRANESPTLGAFVQGTRERAPPVLPGVTTSYGAGLQLSWMVDFWGQYRRATEAARANLLSTSYAADAVRVTLLANVATSYFELRALDRELAASQRIRATNEETLRLTRMLVDGGANPITDELQAKILVEQANAQITQLELSIAQAENQISLLLGGDPGDIARGWSLEDQPHEPEVPVGLPSALLESRPDIREAEEALVAANADVGVAKAAFFPQIPLTATGGASSASLSSLVNGPVAAWSVSGQVAQPLFEGGRLLYSYRLAKTQREAAELAYRQAIQNALGDVANALVGYNKARAYREQLQEQTATYAQTARLANDRYRGGSTGFLEVLTTQQQYLTSELQLAEAWSSEMQNYVQLYQALGGGWRS